MTLSQFFGDDEHTASDGVYFRLLKSRKWLYLTSIIASLHTIGSINYDAITKITAGLLAATSDHAWIGLIIGLITLTAQYVLLIIQGFFSYPSIVRERLAKNSNESFRKLDEERKSASELIVERRRVLQDTFAELRRQIVTLIAAGGDFDPDEYTMSLLQDPALLDVADQDAVDRKRHELRHTSPASKEEMAHLARTWISGFRSIRSMREEELKSSEISLERINENYSILLDNTPERQKIFRWAEYALDGFRLFPPAFIALAVLISLMANSPWSVLKIR